MLTNISRIPTYIDDLDDILGGGIPEGRVIIISGDTGTMKSSLAYYILYNNALNANTKGLYMTIEQEPEDLLLQFESIGLNHDKVNKFISILDIRRLIKDAEKSIGPMIGVITDYKEKQMKLYSVIKERVFDLFRNYEIIVLDSLSALVDLYEIGSNDRETLKFLFDLLKEPRRTTFIIQEKSNSNTTTPIESFIADGIIELFYKEIKDSRQLCLRIKKLRYTRHPLDDFILFHEKGKFKVKRAKM